MAEARAYISDDRAYRTGLRITTGNEINGSKLLIGIMNIQVSEFIKVIFILYMADFFEFKKAMHVAYLVICRFL